MDSEYELLCEKDAMWAETLIQVLNNNQIPCVSLPVYGAGLVMKTGMRERLKIYVMKKDKQAAEDLVQQLFSEEN